MAGGLRLSAPAPLAAPGARARKRAPGAAWLALCAMLGGGSLLAWWAPASLLDWQPGRAATEPWRFVTAAWVHWSGWHLAANLAGTAVVAALGVAARLPARAAAALALAWPLTQAGLWSEPALAHYGGASGVLHAAVAVAACWLIAGARGGCDPGAVAQRGAPLQSPAAPVRRSMQLIGAGIAGGLALKVLLEEPWAGPLAARAWDIAVAPVAHASGALAGTATTLVALALRPRARDLRQQSARKHTPTEKD